MKIEKDYRLQERAKALRQDMTQEERSSCEHIL